MSTPSRVANASSIPILLLKTRSVPNDGYLERFSSSSNGGLKFEPTFVPVLEHQFSEKGLDVVRDLLERREIGNEKGKKYGGMIFTSQRAVEAFTKVVKEGGKANDEAWPHLQSLPIYTVGPATSRALSSIPQSPPLSIHGAENGNGEALAHYMLSHYPPLHPDTTSPPPLLFLVGETRRDIIPRTMMNPALPEDKRIQVNELIVYGTGVMESFEEDFGRILEETCEAGVRWVVVFSPTGCEAMLRALGWLDGETGRAKGREEGGRMTFVATIGPTTRDYLRESFAFEPDVCAERPSPDGVEEGIRAFMNSR